VVLTTADWAATLEVLTAIELLLDGPLRHPACEALVTIEGRLVTPILQSALSWRELHLRNAIFCMDDLVYPSFASPHSHETSHRNDRSKRERRHCRYAAPSQNTLWSIGQQICILSLARRF